MKNFRYSAVSCACSSATGAPEAQNKAIIRRQIFQKKKKIFLIRTIKQLIQVKLSFLSNKKYEIFKN